MNMSFTVEQALDYSVIRDASKHYENSPIDLAAELRNPNSLIYKSFATLVSTEELIKQITAQQQATQQLIIQQRNALKDIATNTSPNTRMPEQMLTEHKQTQEQQAQRLVKKQSELEKIVAQKAVLETEVKSLTKAESAAKSSLASIQAQQIQFITSVLGADSNKTTEQIATELNEYNSASTTAAEFKTVSTLLRNINKAEPEKNEVSNEKNLMPTIIANLSKLKVSYTSQLIQLGNIQISLKLATVSLESIKDLLANTNKAAQQTAPIPQPSGTQKSADENEEAQTTARTPFNTRPFSA